MSRFENRLRSALRSAPPEASADALLARISQSRARHQSRRRATAGALAVAVAGLTVGGAVLLASGDLGPDGPPDSVTTTTTPRPDPTYRHSPNPSGLVARLPGRDVDLPADTSCWTGAASCRRALLLGKNGPDLGTRNQIEFWFARPGWQFSATFRLDDEVCPWATTVEAVRSDGQWFRLPPAGLRGRYVVDLHGSGPEGAVSTRFTWTTTSDGPVDPPRGVASLIPQSLGRGSFAVEVAFEDLPFQPTSSELSRTARVDVTDADGVVRTLTAPLIASSLECGRSGSRGSFYYQLEQRRDVSALGPGPLHLEVSLTIRGTNYLGRATWATGTAPLTFAPPLPTRP